MKEYKSVSKLLEKKKNVFSFSKFFKKILIKTLFAVLLVIIGLIVLKYDKNNGKIIYQFIYENNISFATINSWYNKYFGDILPFQSKAKEKVVSVFDEKLTYQSLNIYKDGISLTVSENYLVPILEDGIVIFIGDKEGYGNTVIIQQVNGIDVWYGNISNPNVKLYDYASKGEFLGITNNDLLYLVFQKQGEFVNYKEYFN